MLERGPKFRKQRVAEFGPAREPEAAPPAEGTSAAQAEELAKFYASLVGTSGERWAVGAEAPFSQEESGANPTGEAGACEGVTILPPGQRYAEPAGPAALEQAQQRISIASSNVGYRLLQKAGWGEGRGIGAREQGALAPVEAHVRKGFLGLGFAPKPAKASAERKAEGNGGKESAAATHQERAPALPPDELADQSAEEKVKRVRQVMQAEADDKAGKTIARYIYSAFNDATGEPTQDANPLLRRNRKLSATNPLL